MKKNTIVAIITGAVILAGGIGGLAWKEYNRFEPKQETVTVELGDKFKTDPAAYIDAGEKALSETKLDASGLDMEKTGIYTLTASWKDKKINIKVKVADTTAPTVKLKETEFQTTIGTAIPAGDIIEKMEDKAGIKEVSFDQGTEKTGTDSKDLLDQVSLRCEEVGTQTIQVIVTDNNGNETKKKIKVKVIEDYLAHVSGIQDITITEGETPDWMEGITADEKVLEVTADASAVDVGTPGEYTLTYIIKGDDNETMVEQEVKVTVKKKVVQQKQASTNNGNSTGSSGGESASASSSESASGGSSNNGESSTNDTWSVPITKTGEGIAEDTGIHWESYEEIYIDSEGNPVNP